MRPTGRIVSSCILYKPVVGLRESAWEKIALSFYAWDMVPRDSAGARIIACNRMDGQYTNRRAFVRTVFAMSVCACFPMCFMVEE